MTKSTANDSRATRSTPGRWLGAFLGLVILVAAATQAAVVPLAHADAGPVVLYAADFSAAPGGSGEPHPDDECMTFACHGNSLVAAPGAGAIAQASSTVTFDRDLSVAGIAILPPLRPPKNSPRI